MDILFDGSGQRRRAMNLGGTSSVSQREVYERARASRQSRHEERQRIMASTKLQATWRGVLERRKVKAELRKLVETDIEGIKAMRCLVLLEGDTEILGQWSEAVCARNEVSILDFATGQTRESWFVLVRQIGVMLLRAVSRNPMSSYTASHLRILTILVTPTIVESALQSNGLIVCREITSYLIQKGYYKLLREALLNAGLDAKRFPILPPITSLLTAPFTVFNEDTQCFEISLRQALRFIFTLPVLPNRLPITSLAELSSRLPLSSIDILEPHVLDLVTSLDLMDKVHLMANMAAFMPPRYSNLKSRPFGTYLKILSSLLAGLAVNSLEPPSSQEVAMQSAGGWDDEDEDIRMTEGVAIASTSIRGASQARVQLDPKSRMRVETLIAPNHLQSLVATSNRHPSSHQPLYTFLLALWTVWPARKDKIVLAIISSAGDGFIRQLYRLHVRSSPLGKSDELRNLIDPLQAEQWPAFLFLTDMYAQMLLTMGDDEFFATSDTSSTSQRAQINPLTVDEVISFSRQAMTVAFVLYAKVNPNDKGRQLHELQVAGTRITFEDVRDRVTRLVQAIHARDSRRPFTPLNHWLFTSQLDMTSFVNAAILDDQEIGSPQELPTARLPRRDLTLLSPRLGVLNNIPFAIPFNVRVEIFRRFIKNDMQRNDLVHNPWVTRTSVSIRRTDLAADGFDKLNSANLKGRVQISFIDQFGEEEAGIDGGGLFKEFFTSLCKEVFDTNRGLWLSTKNHELYPNPHGYAKEPHSLEWYRFIGRILGKAMYDGILVDVAFAGFFLAKWLGKSSFLDDLASLDQELYNGLIFLKHYTGNHEDLSLFFSVDEDDLGLPKVVDLIPNGRNIPVTRENKSQYIILMCHYLLTKQIRYQSEAFFQGLSDMIDAKWLRMFNQQELQILIGGVNSEIDLDDLRSNTIYGGAYKDDHPTIQSFWQVVKALDHGQRSLLLRFATSCSRPPLLGFKELTPRFSIAFGGDDVARLPTASTCVNLLKLPAYPNEWILKEKLLQAINAGAGFNLS